MPSLPVFNGIVLVGPPIKIRRYLETHISLRHVAATVMLKENSGRPDPDVSAMPTRDVTFRSSQLSKFLTDSVQIHMSKPSFGILLQAGVPFSRAHIRQPAAESIRHPR